MAEPGGLHSMGSHRVGHDWSDLAIAFIFVDPQVLNFLFHNISLVTMSSSNVSWFSSQQTSQREEIDNMWFPVGGHALSEFLRNWVFPSVGPFMTMVFAIDNQHKYWWHRKGKPWCFIRCDKRIKYIYHIKRCFQHSSLNEFILLEENKYPRWWQI